MDIQGERASPGEQEIIVRVRMFCTTYRLSPREQQVLNLICRGHHPKDVAEQIGAGYASVRTHLRRTYKKVGCSGLRELVIRFFSEA
ncbi:MAG: helix-turn-helix transcriptional regulator [Polyangiaceae bacterium]